MSGARLSRPGAAQRVAVLVVLAAPLVFLVYAAAATTELSGRGREDLLQILQGDSGAFCRSLAAGVLASLLTAGLGVGAAYLLSGRSLMNFGRSLMPVTVLMPLAVAPLLVGAASFAFLYRDLGTWWLWAFGADARGPAAVLAAETLAQAIRYGPLLLWLLVIVQAETDPERRRYARQSGFARAGYVRTELAMRWLPPLLIVLAFVFQDAANDHLISQLALRPSVATNSELISHALGREFMLLLASRPAIEGIGVIIAAAGLSALSLALGFGLVALTAVGLARAAMSPRFDGAPMAANPAPGTGGAAWVLLPVIVLLIFALWLADLRPSEIAALGQLCPAIAAALLAALVSWALAALCALLLRDGLEVGDGSALRAFSRASAVAIGVGFIPPLGLAAAVFGIAFMLAPDAGGDWGAWLLVAQVARFTPVAFLLLVPAVLAVDDADIRYLKSIGTGFARRATILFLAPNAILHAAVALISFNLVLNEGVISAVFQADVPSLADIMRRATTGRSADYPLAGLLIAVQTLFFGALLLAWGRANYIRWRSADAAH